MIILPLLQLRIENVMNIDKQAIQMPQKCAEFFICNAPPSWLILMLL